jgi:hypothetical protein
VEGNEKKEYEGLEEKVDSKGEKKYLIKGSLLRRADGTIVPTKMFDILSIPLDDYSDLEFSEQEVKRMRMHVMKMKTGIQAMAPCLCSGPVKCVFHYRCPIVDRSIRTADGNDIDFARQDIKKFPILRQCLFEREYLEYQRRSYIEEYDVDTESPTEMGLVNKLAELDLYEYRTTLVLAQGDKEGEGKDLLKYQVSGSTPDGAILMRQEVHPVFELKERLHRMREAILQSMVGTRREQYKQAAALKKSDGDDPSSVISALRDKVMQLSMPPVIDAEFRVKETVIEQPEEEDSDE